MRISVFGLGYVGCVTAACLAREGHQVQGVDVNPEKVDMINRGQSPIIEKGLDDLLAAVVSGTADNGGSLVATVDSAAAIRDTDVSLICVGTPSERNGSLNLDYVRRCAGDIGAGIAAKDDYHLVVVRSTVLPGSVEKYVVPALESSSHKRAGEAFGVAMNPEFLRESTSLHDFYNPPVTVIGELDAKSGATLAQMYEFLDAPLERTTIRTAEMVKYANNSFHGLKVAFANEIGSLCKQLGIDSHPVMQIFCLDDKLNLSPYYLKPGFAFGGSCLPKDLRAITYKAKEVDVDVPVLESILTSNRVHIERAIEEVASSGSRKVGILGLSFKAGTDDLRESPIVSLTEALIGKGFDIRIFDHNVSLARLVGANKAYIEHQIPHISSLLLDSIEAVVEHADVIVIGNSAEEFAEVARGAGPGKTVYDLVRILADPAEGAQGYHGICW